MKKEHFLIVEYPDNNLEDDVTESSNNIRKHSSNDEMKEKDTKMKAQTGNKDRYQEDIKRNEEGILRRPMANTYKFQMISVTNIIILSMLFGTVLAKLRNLRK